MASTPELERQIDALYQRPLTEFTAARNALARGLPAPDAARVRKLVKPAVIPWLINQIFWQARSVYDRMMEAGDAVRRSQINAIERPGATPSRSRQARDRVRSAGERHRQAVADASHQAVRIAAQHQLNPPTDALTRMLEALSLAASASQEPGRLTELTQPTGFEALLGVTLPPNSGPTAQPSRREASTRSGDASDGSAGAVVRSLVDRRHTAATERAREAAERERGRRALAEARAAERSARQLADATSHAQREAEHALARARAAHADASRALENAIAIVNRLKQGLME